MRTRRHRRWTKKQYITSCWISPSLRFLRWLSGPGSQVPWLKLITRLHPIFSSTVVVWRTLAFSFFFSHFDEVVVFSKAHDSKWADEADVLLYGCFSCMPDILIPYGTSFLLLVFVVLVFPLFFFLWIIFWSDTPVAPLELGSLVVVLCPLEI